MAEEKGKKRKKKKHRFFWFMVKLQIFLMLLVLAALGYYYFGGYADEVKALQKVATRLVAASDESMFVPSQTGFVYDINGNLISERSGEKDAEYVTYEDIPAKFISAIISIEDKKSLRSKHGYFSDYELTEEQENILSYFYRKWIILL